MPLDLFLWGHLKSKVYPNKRTTIQRLKDEIVRHIGEIEKKLCKEVIKNLTIEWKFSAGLDGHLGDIIFHTQLP